MNADRTTHKKDNLHQRSSAVNNDGARAACTRFTSTSRELTAPAAAAPAAEPMAIVKVLCRPLTTAPNRPIIVYSGNRVHDGHRGKTCTGQDHIAGKLRTAIGGISAYRVDCRRVMMRLGPCQTPARLAARVAEFEGRLRQHTDH